MKKFLPLPAALRIVGPEWPVSRFDVLPATTDGCPIYDRAAIRAHLIPEH